MQRRAWILFRGSLVVGVRFVNERPKMCLADDGSLSGKGAVLQRSWMEGCPGSLALGLAECARVNRIHA